MKTKIIKVAGLLFACLALFISCAADVGGSSDDENEIEEVKKPKIFFITKDVNYNIQELAGALGDVNRILDSEGKEVTDSSSGIANRSVARFINGEELYYTYPYTLYFYAYLVEYNDFTNSDVLNWMETNEFNSVTDCSFHQCYKSVDYNSQKKYVEVCSYVDENNKAIYCEIRIHYPRDNQEFDDGGKFYSISCNFDPTFTIDTNAGKNIKTKEEAIYVCGDGWNEGENPYLGKTFKLIKSEFWSNGNLRKSTPADRTQLLTFKEDVIIGNENNNTYSLKYFWNAKYKLLYVLGTGSGVPGRWELNGNQLKYIWGVKFDEYDGEQWSTYEDYSYTYYELIQ